MKIKTMNIGFLLFFMVLVKNNLQAQPIQKSFDKMSVGMGITTFGPRLEIGTSLNSHFDLRAGLSLFPYTHKMNFSISAEEYRDYIDYDPDLNVTGKISLTHFHLLSDFKPVTNGVFYFTGGLFLGESVLNMHGILVNPSNQRPTADDLRDAGYIEEDVPPITFEEDYVFQPERDGSVRAKLKLGNFIKPYLGIGIGRTIPKKKVGVKFELGVIYQGKPDISSVNLVEGDLNNLINQDEELKKYEPYFHWYPMLNFQISYRIF